MTTKEKICSWIALSLIIQLAVLFYIDYYFLGNFGIVTGQTWGTYSFQNYTLHDEAEDIKVSHDGMFASYKYNGKLHLVDLKNNKDLYTMSFEGFNPSFYRWLPDRNRIIAIFKNTENKSAFKIYAYDCDSKSEIQIQNLNNLPVDSEVENIQLSTFTNIIYIVIKNNNNPILYRIGIMGDKTRVYPSIRNFTNLKQCNLKDIVLYENPSNKRVYVQEGPEAWTIALESNAYLLGIDSDDNIYLAKDSNGKCSSIKYGKLNTNVASWHNINLEENTEPNNIIIQHDGTIFIKNEEQNYILKIENGSKTIYEGKFLELHDNFIVSLHNKRIKIIPVNL